VPRHCIAHAVQRAGTETRPYNRSEGGKDRAKSNKIRFMKYTLTTLVRGHFKPD
jgi:hypothetical protein